MVRPNLTRRPDDRHGLFLATAHYSPLLRRGFYDGYAMSWCCDWLRDHRSLEFDLGEGVGRPIPGAGDRPLVYQGDDPVAQKAVLRNTATGELFWYDGAQVLNPWPDRVGPLLPWRKDPQTGDPLLRDAKGKPYRFDGATAAPLDVTGVLDGPARWLGYRPAFDRWILATEREWYRYQPGKPLVPLGMPARVASAWPPDLIDTPAGMDRSDLHREQPLVGEPRRRLARRDPQSPEMDRRPGARPRDRHRRRPGPRHRDRQPDPVPMGRPPPREATARRAAARAPSPTSSADAQSSSVSSGPTPQIAARGSQPSTPPAAISHQASRQASSRPTTPGSAIARTAAPSVGPARSGTGASP